MDELLAIKQKLLVGDIPAAVMLIEELEEMSKDDKINNIRSFAVVLLLHLIKQQAEQRTTKSWNVSVLNSAQEIRDRNKRRKSGGTYLSPEELLEVLEEAYTKAVRYASLEVEEGRYQPLELATILDKDGIIVAALRIINDATN